MWESHKREKEEVFSKGDAEREKERGEEIVFDQESRCE